MAVLLQVQEKNSTRDMGIPPSTFFSELMEGLTLFFSIIEIVLLVTPARLASSRWERPLSFRMVCRRAPTSKGGVLLILLAGKAKRGRTRLATPSRRYHGNTVQYLQQIGRHACAKNSESFSQAPE